MTNRTLKVYSPLPQFPPISLSSHCELGCRHCHGHYLHGMTCITQPHKLLGFAQRLANQGGTGILVSGGFTTQGTLMNLQRMLPTLALIKKTNRLLVALHTGFVTKKLAGDLKKNGVDMAFTHCIGDMATIKDIMGLSATPQDYLDTLKNLQDAHIPVVPHICIGLHQGNLRGETQALRLMKKICAPAAIVVTTLIPTRGTPLEHGPPPAVPDILGVIREAQQSYPTVEIALGCMRTRGGNLEYQAVQAGVTRIANPSRQFLSHITREGYCIETYAACCGLPTSLQQFCLLSTPPPSQTTTLTGYP